jgi:hypothetical protein
MKEELARIMHGIAETATLEPDKPSRRQRRFQEAMLRRHAFTEIGRKTRNLCKRKYEA